jgi:tetratricopeptide (TPR) repeat protein
VLVYHRFQIDESYTQGLVCFFKAILFHKDDTRYSMTQALLEEAFQHFQTMQEKATEILGKDHLMMAESYRMLAHTLLLQDKLEEAQKMCTQALELHEHFFSNTLDHPDQVAVRFAMAQIYVARKHYQEANSMMEGIEAYYHQHLGPTHYETTRAREIQILLHQQRDPTATALQGATREEVQKNAILSEQAFS